MSARLDDRARRAAGAIRAAVPAVPPDPFRTPAAAHPAWAALGGALVAAMLLTGIWLLRPPIVADEVTTSTTVAVTTTTVPPSTTTPSTTTPPTPPVSTAPIVPAAPGTTGAPADVTPPELTITSPSEGAVFTEKTLAFEGLTEPGAQVFAGPYEADVDADGRWRIVLVLSPGSNLARFRAVDAAGNESTASVTVILETTTPEKQATAPFVAHYTWGECSVVPPYDEYHGTGEPFSKVTVSSAYGGGTTKVNADGTWALRVEFPGAPIGKTFPVEVSDSLGRKVVFEFTAVEG